MDRDLGRQLGVVKRRGHLLYLALGVLTLMIPFWLFFIIQDHRDLGTRVLELLPKLFVFTLAGAPFIVFGTVRRPWLAIHQEGLVYRGFFATRVVPYDEVSTVTRLGIHLQGFGAGGAGADVLGAVGAGIVGSVGTAIGAGVTSGVFTRLWSQQQVRLDLSKWFASPELDVAVRIVVERAMARVKAGAPYEPLPVSRRRGPLELDLVEEALRAPQKR